MKSVSTVFAALCAALSLGGCLENKSSPKNHPGDAYATQYVNKNHLSPGLCDKIADLDFFERIEGVATAVDRPAFVYGIRFNCINNFGKLPQEYYLGWIENYDLKAAQCIHFNDSKAVVLNSGWEYCGGNFRVKQ